MSRPALLLRGLVPAGLVALLSSTGLQAQTAVTRVEENFRMEPNGVLLGVLSPNVELPVHQQRDQWIEAELEGWMWIRSLQVTSRGGFDLVVSAAEGENVRTEPSGRVVAKLQAGTLLEELERRPGWIRVRRRGWIWAPSTRVRPANEAPASPSASRETAPTAAPEPAPEAAAPGPTGLGGVLVAGPRGAAVLGAPDGDTLALTIPYADLQVVSREGGWTRVRLEGWVWSPEGGDSIDAAPATGVSPADVMAAPDRFRGRVVTWELQYISLERAEQIRTDFFEGEPFLLTRPLEGADAFVYVAVPQERLSDLDGLVPLERVTVVGRVRVGASSLTGSPVIDLLELRRGRAGRQEP